MKRITAAVAAALVVAVLATGCGGDKKLADGTTIINTDGTVLTLAAARAQVDYDLDSATPQDMHAVCNAIRHLTPEEAYQVIRKHDGGGPNELPVPNSGQLVLAQIFIEECATR